MDFYTRMTSKFDNLKKLFLQKNHDQYANDNPNPLNAFRKGAIIKYENDGLAFQYCVLKDFMLKHISHIKDSSIKTPKLKESLEDIAVYCLIASCMIEMYEEQESQIPEN